MIAVTNTISVGISASVSRRTDGFTMSVTPKKRNDDRLSRGADDWSEADYLSQTQFNADERAVAAYQLARRNDDLK